MTDLRNAVINTIKFFIDNPHKHLQGALARDGYNQIVNPVHPEACRWCFLGRLAKEINGEHFHSQMGELTIYAKLEALHVPKGTIIEANDEGGLDDAIKVAKRELL